MASSVKLSMVARGLLSLAQGKFGDVHPSLLFGRGSAGVENGVACDLRLIVWRDDVAT